MTAALTTWTPPQHDGPPRNVQLPTMLANVLESLCEGKSNRQIATDWGISEDTVKTHMRRLFRKIGARDRLHAAVLVYNGELQVQVRPKEPTRVTPARPVRPQVVTRIGEWL